MNKYGLKQGEEYILVPNYTMKCRIYPNNRLKKEIDDHIHGVGAAHNMALYDSFVNGRNLKESVDKETGKVYHYIDFSAMSKAEYLNELRSENEYIKNVPSGALSGYNGVIRSDLNRMMALPPRTKSKNKIKRRKRREYRKNKNNKPIPYPIECVSPRYYKKEKKRRSYTYQQTFKSMIVTDNPNVFKIKLTNTSEYVNVRGWNKRIRFGERREMNVVEYLKSQNKKTTVTVLRDNCGDYFICFYFEDCVYTPVLSKHGGQVGIDVGVKTSAVVSDGYAVENRHFKLHEKAHLAKLNQQLSRRQGFANVKFRDKYKKDKSIKESKRYLHTKLSRAKLERKVCRRRENYYHTETKNIVSQNEFIGVESLNITSMYRDRNRAYGLFDAAMGTFLDMIKYKSQWYRRVVQPIDRWTPSSKRCSCCKDYIYKNLTTDIREWVCPVCNAHHDRDLNAAKNILDYALVAFNSSKLKCG